VVAYLVGGAWQARCRLARTTFGISFGLTTITLAWVTGRPRIADHQPGGCCWARWPCAPPTPDSRHDHATQGDQLDLHHSDAIAAAQAMRDEFGS
jgi:hypothetical protein